MKKKYFLTLLITLFITTFSFSQELIIYGPIDGQVLEARTSIDIQFVVNNFNIAAGGTGDGYIKWELNDVAQADKTDINDITLTVAEGMSYKVYMELVDNSGTVLSTPINKTVNFSIANPCNLVLPIITTQCDALTSGIDTYNGSITFTGGNTGDTYTITAPVGVIVGGDNPNTSASGKITFTGMTEGVNTDITIIGGATSSCDYTLTITSPLCLPTPTCPSIGDLVITEIMQNPNSVGDSEGEYFEIYNKTSSPIDLLGWIIRETSNPFADIITESVIVPANGYIVLGNNTDKATNGGVTVAYDYGVFLSLGNGADDLILDCNGTTIDSVDWDGGSTFPDPTGKSMELATNKYTSTDNDDGANWSEAVTEIKTGGDFGTPGVINNFVLSVEDDTIQGFTVYPNPVQHGRLTVTTSNSKEKKISFYSVLGKRVFTQKFSGNKKQLDVSQISSGIYIMKLLEGDKIATKKIVIK